MPYMVWYMYSIICTSWLFAGLAAAGSVGSHPSLTHRISGGREGGREGEREGGGN